MITVEQILELGWSKSYKEGVYSLRSETNDKTYLLYRFDDSPALSIGITFNNHLKSPHNKYEVFRGQLSTDNHQNELKLLMRQIGINRPISGDIEPYGSVIFKDQ